MSLIELQAWLPSSDLSGAPDHTFATDDQLVDAGFNPVLWGEGDGFLEIHADDPDTQYLQRRGFIRAVRTDTDEGLFWWILEEGSVKLLGNQGKVDRVIRWEGRGMLYYLDRYKLGQAVWAPGQPYRGSYNVIDYWTWDQIAMIGILTRFMEEGQNDTRADFLDKLDYDFSRTDDSNGNALTALTDYQVRIGTGGLTLAADAMRQGNLLQVLPSTPPMLQAFRALSEYRTDRTSATYASGKVRFAAGDNIATELPHKIVALRERTHTLTRRQDGQYATEDNNGSGEPYMDYMEVPHTSDPVAVEAAVAQSHLNRQKQSTVAVIRHQLGPGGTSGAQGYFPSPAGHYWLGDLVTVDSGSGEYDLDEQALEVAGIRYFLRGADWMVEAQLGAQVINAAGQPVNVGGGGPTIIRPSIQLCQPDVDNSVQPGALIGAGCSGDGANYLSDYAPWSGDREERVEIAISQAVPAGYTIIVETSCNRLWGDSLQVYDEQGNTWTMDAAHENTASSGDNYIQIWRCNVTNDLAVGDYIRFAVNVGTSLSATLERGAKCIGAFTFTGQLDTPTVGTGAGSFSGSANISTPAGDVVIAGLALWGTQTLTDDVDWTDMIPRQLGNFGASDNTTQLMGQYLLDSAASTWTVGFSSTTDYAAIAVGYVATGDSFGGDGPLEIIGMSIRASRCDHNHYLENLLTEETDTSLVPHPDGAGGVEWGADAGAGLAVEDEGTEEGTGIDRLDFTGAGVSVSVTGTQATIDIPAGGGSSADDPIADVFGAADTAFEFDTSSLTGLTAIGTATAEDADTSIPGHLYLMKAATSSVALTGRYAAAPTAPFTAIAKLSDHTTVGTNFERIGGLFIGPATPGAIEAIHVVHNSDWLIAHETYTSPTAFNASIGTNLTTKIISFPLYFGIVVNSNTDVDFWFSWGGRIWRKRTDARNPSMTIGSVGIVIDPESATHGVSGAYDFLRIWNSAKTFPGF